MSDNFRRRSSNRNSCITRQYIWEVYGNVLQPVGDRSRCNCSDLDVALKEAELMRKYPHSFERPFHSVMHEFAVVKLKNGFWDAVAMIMSREIY